MARALDLELKCWDQDAAPQKLDGHCHSELAIDIIQIISQGQAKAEEITPDVGAQMKRVLQVELAAVLRRWGMGVCARGRGSLQLPRSEPLPLPSPCALGGHPGWISAPSLPPGHLAF